MQFSPLLLPFLGLPLSVIALPIASPTPEIDSTKLTGTLSRRGVPGPRLANAVWRLCNGRAACTMPTASRSGAGEAPLAMEGTPNVPNVALDDAHPAWPPGKIVLATPEARIRDLRDSDEKWQTTDREISAKTTEFENQKAESIAKFQQKQQEDLEKFKKAQSADETGGKLVNDYMELQRQEKERFQQTNEVLKQNFMTLQNLRKDANDIKREEYKDWYSKNVFTLDDHPELRDFLERKAELRKAQGPAPTTLGW